MMTSAPGRDNGALQVYRGLWLAQMPVIVDTHTRWPAGSRQNTSESSERLLVLIGPEGLELFKVLGGKLLAGEVSRLLEFYAREGRVGVGIEVVLLKHVSALCRMI